MSVGMYIMFTKVSTMVYNIIILFIYMYVQSNRLCSLGVRSFESVIHLDSVAGEMLKVLALLDPASRGATASSVVW